MYIAIYKYTHTITQNRNVLGLLVTKQCGYIYIMVWVCDCSSGRCMHILSILIAKLLGKIVNYNIIINDHNNLTLHDSGRKP